MKLALWTIAICAAFGYLASIPNSGYFMLVGLIIVAIIAVGLVALNNDER